LEERLRAPAFTRGMTPGVILMIGIRVESHPVSFEASRWLLAAAVCAFLGAEVQVSAQDTFRQTVVVTAASTPVELGSITRSLTIVTRGQLSQLPVRSVADALRLVTSVDVRARGERGVQSDFSLRGAGFGQMLVLVDGVRINDAQSGHHNGDIPVPLDAVERIEILHGPGSSLFGADAFGGTINVITRREVTPASALIEGGSFDLAAARAQVGFESSGVRQLLAGSADRSSGFMYERQFRTASLSSRTLLGTRSGISASYLWKDFGANGFYGPAPSHEWTNQTLLSGDHRFDGPGGWGMTTDVSYRTHGDHFLFDVRRPGVSENRHRTHAVRGALKATHSAGTRASVTAGLDGGADWVRSSNLGDHSLARMGAYVEWRQVVGEGVQVDSSLRVEGYDEFGMAWSPSLGIAWWPTIPVRLRGSVGRAFRVPTFTERYYTDPANRARPDVGPEAAWAGEVGADLFLGSGWIVQGTVFGRKDRDVIDWLRATPADQWQTYNVHHVDTHGVELSLGRSLPGGAFVQAGYTGLDVSAASITLLSKYILEYAPHTIAAAAVIPLPGRVRLAPTLSYKRRQRNRTTFDYTLIDLRVSREFGRYELRLDGSNLGNASYQEIAGVAMPGRAASAGLGITWN
jgi:iron complex outermembrane receptor protein